MDIRFLAKMIISCSDEVAELLTGLQGNTAVSKLGVDCDNWGMLYRKHRQLQGKLLENFFDFGKDGKVTEENRASFEDTRNLFSGLKKNEIYEKLQILANEFFESPLNDNAFNLSEVIFFIKVWFPCWLVYGEYPTRLIRKARQNDLKSLEKLLRIDNKVLLDKKISGIWARLGQNRRSIHYQNLQKSLNGLSKKQISRKNSKVRIAAFIFEFAKALGQPLTYDEIYIIFDEVSKERFQKQDSDIQDDQAAFKKAIQRNSKETPYLLNRDKI